MTTRCSRSRVDGECDAPDYTSNGDLRDWEALDRVLEELPPGVPILPPEHATDFSRYRRLPRSLWTKDEAWQGCVEVVEKYDAEMCKAYREEIDTLLVFAGLFSAVVTGFTVEAYQWLQEDSNDAILTVLSQIASSVGPTTSVAAAPTSSGMARSVSIRINAYWFLALCQLGYCASSDSREAVGREYERHAAMRPQEYIGVRQTKLEGFNFWKVGDIISALPLLLQLSLALFVLGVID